MVKLRGHFDGHVVVLDEPVPDGWVADTPVEIQPVQTRDQLIAEWLESLREWHSRPLPEGFVADGKRTWKREDLYDRGSDLH